MKTVREVAELRELVSAAKRSGQTVGFVPTMGALHSGHLALVARARAESGLVAVSIFVNPLQFSPGEDFARYPRRAEEDAALLESAGAQVLYLPDPERFYADDFSTSIEVAGVTEGGEGAARPGHFRGVATVVVKLFLQVAPDAAYFGRKDLQQTAVVRRMVRDLDFPIRIVVAETVRENDGLAMSSRNAYLSEGDRTKALALSRALFAARDRARAGHDEAESLEADARREMESAGLAVDYVEAVDPSTMRRAARAEAGTAIAAAVRVGKTRLIDNVLIASNAEAGRERNRP